MMRTDIVFTMRARRGPPLETMSIFFIEEGIPCLEDWTETVLCYYVCLGRSTNFSQGRGKRVKGIEPSSVAWKATALPLSYTRAIASCRHRA